MQKALSKIDDLFRYCTFRITVGNNSGTGFFVAPNFALTCAHVFEISCEDSNKGNLAQVCWRNRYIQAEIIERFSATYPDIALLKLNVDDHPCVYFDEAIELGDKLYAYGYPEKYIDGDSLLFDYEGPTNHVQSLLKMKGAQATPGFSGAPLLNLRTSKVCAILKTSRDIYSDLGGRAIPITTVYEHLSYLRLMQKQYHLHDRLWLSFTNTSLSHSEMFVQNVAMSIKSLGYNIKSKAEFIEKGADIYAELHQPLQTHRLLVKCISNSNKVDITILKEFAFLVDTLSTKAEPLSGLVVSKAGFTSKCNDFAKQTGILTMSLDQLVDESFNPDSVASYIVASFDRDSLKNVYIELSCQVTEVGKGTIYKPVEKFFDDYYFATKRLGIAVLGNFGSGKSSLSRHYSYLLAQRWLQDSAQKFLPIYISLRDLKDFHNLEVDLLDLICTTDEKEITLNGFRNWLINGSTLLILDGFDEMATKMDKLEINRNLEALQKFCTKYNIKLLLTCRTHFFKTQVDEQALGNILRLYLLDWGAKELEEYICKSHFEDADTSLSLIRNTYNLQELAKTPIFLNMISETLDHIAGRVNQAKLYQIYTTQWFQQQDYRSKLSFEDKQLFMEELALEMFFTSKLRIGHSSLPSRIRELLYITDYELLKSIDSDIRTCTFLVRNPEGEYHFVHKSFMEYFVAYRLAQEVKSANYKHFSRQLLTIEVASFFANYFDEEVDYLVRGLLSDIESTSRANFALAIGCLPFSQIAYNALVIAIRTDKNSLVQHYSIDALSMFREESVAIELINLVKEQNHYSNHCLKKLAPFGFNSPQVFEFFKIILTTSENKEHICIVLENIAQIQCEQLMDDIKMFIDKKEMWKHNMEIVRALTKAIQAIADLSLAMRIKVLEERVTNQPLLTFIEESKVELRTKFRNNINEDARNNKAQGALNRRSNATQIYQKYDFLVDAAYLNNVLDQLYPQTTRIKKGRKN